MLGNKGRFLAGLKKIYCTFLNKRIYMLKQQVLDTIKKNDLIKYGEGMTEYAFSIFCIP